MSSCIKIIMEFLGLPEPLQDQIRAKVSNKLLLEAAYEREPLGTTLLTTFVFDTDPRHADHKEKKLLTT